METVGVKCMDYGWLMRNCMQSKLFDAHQVMPTAYTCTVRTVLVVVVVVADTVRKQSRKPEASNL